jgi:MFS family permease
LEQNRNNDGAWPNPIYAWFVVLVLMLAYTNSFIDRTILSLLVEPIQRDLNINDTQFSLLVGFAFTLFYTLMGVPIARLADQKNRKTIIAIGIASWSFMTAVCGLTKNFWQLFSARIGVGIGEATLSPAAMSMISDYFPVHKLARAISVYSMGVYFGAGLAMLIGALVVDAVAGIGVTDLPIIGEVYPWQLTFFYVGLLGLPIFLLVLLVREPLRRGVAKRQIAEQGSASSWPELRAFMKKNIRTISLHFAAFSCIGIGLAGYLVWTPALFIRTYGWSAPEIGRINGVILFFAGTAGVFAGGVLADWLEKRGRSDAILRAAYYAGLAVIPFAVLTPLMPNPWFAVAGLTATIFLLALSQGLPAAALQVIAPNPLRAQMTAIYFLVGNLIANALGPTLFALATDYLFRDPMKLRYSLSLVCALLIPLGVVCAFLALKPYRQSVAASRAETNIFHNIN